MSEPQPKERTDYAETMQDEFKPACESLENEVLRYLPPDEVLTLKDELARRYGISEEATEYPWFEDIRRAFDSMTDREKAFVCLFDAMATADNNPDCKAGAYLWKLHQDKRYSIWVDMELSIQDGKDSDVANLAKIAKYIESLTL